MKNLRRPTLLIITTVSMASSFSAFPETEGGIKGYPDEIREIRYPVEIDDSEQPALFWKPDDSGKKAPLLVAMHTWSGDYRQAGGEVKYAEWCLQNDWVFLHPNFRGRNRTPQSMGSDFVIADVRAAVEWAKENANVDELRIYAIGVSGGGHATLLLAGRTPDIWSGISSWCGISDIAAWHAQTMKAGRENYAKDIEMAIGGPPLPGSMEANEATHRSPLTWLENASSVPLDINHGIDDGREGSVPFTHSLLAYNAVVPESEKISDRLIDWYYQDPKKHSDLSAHEDALYGDKRPILRSVHKNTRVTIFDGGHEIIHLAALNWLAAQRKGQPADWNPPKVSDLKTSEKDSQSGK